MAASGGVAIGLRRPRRDTPRGISAADARRRLRAVTPGDTIGCGRDVHADGVAAVAPTREADGPIPALRTPKPASAQAIAAPAASSQEFR